jgi:hypothetical protein
MGERKGVKDGTSQKRAGLKVKKVLTGSGGAPDGTIEK